VLLRRIAMKLTRTIFIIICLLAAAGLALRVAAERETRIRLDQQGSALREQLSQMDQVIAENQRLSNLVAQAKDSPARPTSRPEVPLSTDVRSKELVRLRGEVEALRQQSKEIAALREDTRQVRAAQNSVPVTQSAGQVAATSSGTATNGSQFEILKAEYWTEKATLDVTGELTRKVLGEATNVVANNDLKGDPDLGHTKRLTVVYRIGDVTRTNEFREGQPVIFPGE
jgi:hypothetical protein